MRRVVGAFATVSLVMLASAQAQDVTLEVSSATIGAGSTGQISVTLNAGTNEVAGTENELNWNPDELVVENCVVNEEIDKDLQSNLGEGTFKGIIINFTDLSPIDDGSVLYTCDVTVGASTPPGEYTITCTNPASSDPEGGPGDGFDTACNDATITVPEEPQVMLTLSDVELVPGGTSTLEISLELLKDVEVAGTENVLRWNPAELSVTNCVANTAHGKDLQQSNPGPGEFKGLIISFTDLSPIADGILLYSCDVGLGAGTAAATTSGVVETFEIECAEPGSSDPLGNELITVCNNSTVTVVEPTPIPTQTAIPPTATATPEEPTVGPTGVATNTPGQPTVAPATNTPIRRQVDDDGCSVAPAQNSSAGWTLLLPLAALLWLRRRQK